MLCINPFFFRDFKDLTTVDFYEYTAHAPVTTAPTGIITYVIAEISEPFNQPPCLNFKVRFFRS